MGTEEECGNVQYASKLKPIVNLQKIWILFYITNPLSKINHVINKFISCRKPAMFEGLEIDQYIWSVLQNKQTSEFDEVTIDQNAKFKPCLPAAIKV